MTRDKKLEIRLSSTELNIIEKNSQKANMKKSDYVRKMLLEEPNFNTNSKPISAILFNMQTLVNQSIQYEDNISYLENLAEEMNKLWLYL